MTVRGRSTIGRCEVVARRADREKTSEKPPNPRRGTSLKEKLIKAIGLKDKTYSKIERNRIKPKRNKRRSEPHRQV